MHARARTARVPTARAPVGAPVLLLVPTELEARALLDQGGIEPGLAVLERCGFGPVAAAARSAALIAKLTPARVLLLGIAGSYDPERLPVGSAASFSRAALDGLDTAGFEQAPGIGPVLDLSLPRRRETESRARDADLLLSVVWPSGTPAEARSRKDRSPAAAAEDMEGYGVAMACAQAGVPLCVVRGISNVAGDRDRGNWRIAEALSAARALALELLREASDPEVRSTSGGTSR